MAYRLDIPGQVSVYQLRAIEAVASLVPQGGKVVEVGSLFGRSSWAWGASVHPETQVYCIDPWEANIGVRTMEARYGVKYGLEQFVAFTSDLPNVHARRGYSPRDFQDWDQPIDLYYEDAVHTDPILATNLDFWSGKLKPGGILCGDDYRPRFPDVRAGAHRLAERFARELITVENFWCLLPSESECPGAGKVAALLRTISAEADADRRREGLQISIGPRLGVPGLAQGEDVQLDMRVANDSLDSWPPTPGAPLRAAMYLYATVPARRRVAEAVADIGVSRLEPDMPVDFTMTLPTARLAPGRYVAVPCLLDGQGAVADGKNPDTASGVAIEVPADEPAPAAPSPTPLVPAPVQRETREPLFDPRVARSDFTSAVFSDSHGAFDGYLGAGSLYYALTQVARAQVAVCIGSGGGFVPSLLRRAQLDAGMAPASTYLVDANLGELAFGSPVQQGGWLTEENEFLRREHDIVVLSMLSSDAARLFASQGITIDYLHIDGDHSKPGVLADLRDYAPLLSEHAVVTLHDLRMPSVAAAIDEWTQAQAHWQVLRFPEVGAGTAVLRRSPEQLPERRVQSRSAWLQPQRRVLVDLQAARTASKESLGKAQFERWNYLTSPAYRLRYDVIARLLDEPGSTVVEVGGYPNSVLGSFERCARVHAVEPYAPQEFGDELQARARQRGQQFVLHKATLGDLSQRWREFGAYRLVALGLDLSSGLGDDEDAIRRSLSAFFHAASRAEQVAIEVPRYAPSLVTLEAIEQLLVGRRTIDVTLDLSNDPAADEYHVKDGRAQRRIMVFEPRAGLDAASALVQERLATVAARIHALRSKEEQPAEVPVYRLGEELLFTTQGNARPYLRQGWVGAEARHTWTVGPSSRLVMRLAGLDGPAGGCRLTLMLKPFVVQGKLAAQSLAISANGHEVYTGRLDGPTTVKAEIPAQALAAGSRLTIDLSHPDGRRPAELLSGSRDQKVLAFAVQSLRIDSL